MSKYPNKLVNDLGKKLLEIEQEHGVETQRAVCCPR